MTTSVHHMPLMDLLVVILHSPFRKTVRAICEAIPLEHGARSEEGIEFILRQHRSMPDYLSFPFEALTLFFNFYPLLLGGSSFNRLPLEGRRRQIERWRKSRFGYLRDFIRFYESLALFYSYSEFEKRHPEPAS